MYPSRFFILIILVISALASGALFILPPLETMWVRLEVNGVPLLAEIADTPAAKAKGLAGRAAIPAHQGMLFIFDRPDRYGIWMKSMRFPIDIFWIKSGAVADLEENVLPAPAGLADYLLPVYRPDIDAEYVLEAGAGFARRYNIHIGDEVKIFFSKHTVARAKTPGGFPGGAPDDAGLTPPSLPGSEYFIETLRRKPPLGTNFRIERVLERGDSYQKFQISYEVEGLVLGGVMNVPGGEAPEGGFPVIILNHGLIRPEIYVSGRGSKREQDFLARQGYVTLHPDYRGYASSSPYTFSHHDFFVGFTADVSALLDALQELRTPTVNLEKLGVWGHSMGGAIATRLMVLRPEIRAYVLFAPNSPEVRDNFYELPQAEVGWLEATYGGAWGERIYSRISPLTYFPDASAPVQIHHGTLDDDVPIEFSEKIFGALQSYGKKTEFFKYPGEGHEFGDAWPVAAERALQFFDRYVKGAR